MLLKDKARNKAIAMIVEGMEFFRPSTAKPVPSTMENRAGIILEDLTDIFIAEIMPFDTLSEDEKRRLIDQLSTRAIVSEIFLAVGKERKENPDLVDISYGVIEAVSTFNANTRDDYHDLNDQEMDQLSKDTINNVFERVSEAFPYKYKKEKELVDDSSS